MSSSGSAAQLTCTNRSRPRRLLRWIARATSSLPTPLSPWMRTVLLVGAARPIASVTSSSAGLSPTISWRILDQFAVAAHLRLQPVLLQGVSDVELEDVTLEALL